MNSKFVIAALVVIGVAVAASFLNPTPAYKSLSKQEVASIANGEIIYANSCAACHGANLEGQANWQTPMDNGQLPAPPHDKSGHTWHHADSLLLKYIDLGGAAALAEQGVENFNSGMPGFGGILSNRDIFDVLAYIKSTWPAREREIQESRNTPAPEG